MIATQPTTEAIAKRAYELYLERGGQPGNEAEDWLRAERELIERAQAAATPVPTAAAVPLPVEPPVKSPRPRVSSKTSLGLARKRPGNGLRNPL